MSRAPTLATLMAASAVSVVTLNMLLPALAQMARDFGVSYGTAGWAVSGYLGVTAVLMLLLGPASDRFGRRPVILTCLALFTLFSIICALATSFSLFLMARMGQGVVIAGSTVALATLRDTLGPEAAARKISWVAMGMAVGPMLGPVIGGLLDQAFGWRAIFWALSGAGAALFLLAWTDWRETNTRRMSSFGEQLRAFPILLRSPTFWAFAGAVVAGVGVFYIFITGAPLVADLRFEMTSAELGLAVGIITFGYFFGNGVSGRVAERLGLGTMVLMGRALQVCVIALNLALVATGYLHPFTYFGLMILVGFGNGLANPSCHAGVMSVDARLAGSAAGLSGALVLGFGAIFTAISARAIEGGAPATTLLVVMLILSLFGLLAGVAAYALTARAPSRAAKI